MALNVPVNDNKKLKSLLEAVNCDEEIAALWSASNVTAIDRSHISDHGPTHVAITVNAALKMLRNLVEAGVEPSAVCDHKLEEADAEVVVFLAACMHDVGHIVHRHDHALHSVAVASPVVKRLLEPLYPIREATLIYADVLHAIVCHMTQLKPLTVEAGVVRIADALDMSHGRSRIPFSIGEKGIHSVSAQSIEKVSIGKSKEKPVVINVEMTNSAGIFQVDNLLKEKIRGSGIEEYVKVSAKIRDSSEPRILDSYEFEL